MKIWVAIALCWLLLPPVGSAEIATTWETNTGRSVGVVSQFAVDVIGHGIAQGINQGVWLATGRGVNYTLDDGMTWLVYDELNGLPTASLSAIFSVDGRLWVATNHEELIDGQLYSLSDGLSFTDDDGLNWTTLDFSPSGLDIPWITGGDRTIYDITGHHDLGFFDNRTSDNDVDWLFFTAFAGGLLASQDGGENWRRIFPLVSDSIAFSQTGVQPTLRNLYFSCAVDTTHGDSVFLWSGTAGGVFQYVYAPPRDKLYSKRIHRLAFCDTCNGTGGSVMFLAGDNGVSRAQLGSGKFITRFEVDGLPASSISAVTSMGSQVIVGAVDPATGLSGGLAISTDLGEQFSLVTESEVVGDGRTVSDFAKAADRLYLAGDEAGLMVSLDTGWTWNKIMVDSLDPFSPLNRVHGVTVHSSNLLLGTDTGYVEYEMDGAGNFLSTYHQAFPEEDSSSSKVVRIKAQDFIDSLGGIDSTIIWTIHRPLTGSGQPMVGRRGFVFDTTFALNPPDSVVAIDTSFAWAHLQIGVETHDINFFGDTAFVVGDGGIRFTSRGTNPATVYSARMYNSAGNVIDVLDNDTITTMEIIGDTVIFGTGSGVAISTNWGDTTNPVSFAIRRTNTDSLAADFTINYNVLTSNLGLGGDFIPVLGMQTLASGPGRIWVSSRPTDFGGEAISSAEYEAVTDTAGDTTGYALVWTRVLDGRFAWNFGFVGDSTFAATDDGLLLNSGNPDSGFVDVPLRDNITGELLIDPGHAVYGVEEIDGYLWVTTGDGTVRINLATEQAELFSRVDRTTAANEVYAFPVPFRPQSDQTVDFHFVIDAAGPVTLEVYDFAMNLVARPIDHVTYEAGIYPDGGSQGRTWDGRNDLGVVVAVGVYYFKVEQAAGETRWGKIAVIP